MEDSDSLPTISGNVIMAYGEVPHSYVRHKSDNNICTCLFWSRYTVFVLNFFILAAGVTMTGLGSWALVHRSGLELFETLLTEPSWMLIGTGIVMIIVGIFGIAGALRLNALCLRAFMLVVVVVFIVQLALGGVVFFLMDDIKDRMVTITKEAVRNYGVDDNLERDEALNYLQREFQCCGGSSYSDWNSNPYYNCSSYISAAACGVPKSCCRESDNNQCGYNVRGGTEDYAEMFIYTEGCIAELMRIFKNNVIVIAVLNFTVCALEIVCLILANIMTKHIVYHRKLIT